MFSSQSLPVTDVTRRQFCTGLCHVSALAALGITLESCGGGSPAGPSGDVGSALPMISASVANNAFMLTVDAASPLAAVGSAALAQTSAGNFLLARTTQDAILAFTATCTHEACTITRFDSGAFACPCHGSRFSTAGAVLNGPASRALRQFATQFAANVLTVSVV